MHIVWPSIVIHYWELWWVGLNPILQLYGELVNGPFMTILGARNSSRVDCEKKIYQNFLRLVSMLHMMNSHGSSEKQKNWLLQNRSPWSCRHIVVSSVPLLHHCSDITFYMWSLHQVYRCLHHLINLFHYCSKPTCKHGKTGGTVPIGASLRLRRKTSWPSKVVCRVRRACEKRIRIRVSVSSKGMRIVH